MNIPKLDSHPVSLEGNIVSGSKFRISVLTSSLIRLEYSDDGIFENRATQKVINRDFPLCKFDVSDKDNKLEINTDSLYLCYDKKAFSENGLSIKVKGNLTNYLSEWQYNDKIDDLRGTARTLDGVDGKCELDHGLVSKNGFSILDDSISCVITEDGWVEGRKEGVKDLYFFGHGHDYLGCLKDFYYLCGKTPMIPRFALGNWWSRWHEYTEESYNALMDRFDKENVPFSVAVIDMDWHLVDIDPKYGSGWTGFSWNKKMFPDPARFLTGLHKRGMKTTTNIHPADGIRAYEDYYKEAAKVTGADIEKEEPVAFDVSDKKSMEAYFEYGLHPNEDLGVDFWWIDWQQGSASPIKGLDPLWMLNHLHYLDSARNGKRPLTFSRYAGPGSHRYPIGFSGDTQITWNSLDFQPYFTANSTNVGYGWWSHDIGGHFYGYRSENLMCRWLQSGVFSPITRLHSNKNRFISKEPWNYSTRARAIMDDFLRLRHKMIPYLYTMNYRAWHDDTPLVLPMYYQNPDNNAAYSVRNEYYFGSQLICAPITTKDIPDIGLGKVRVWLPEGLYTDVFTGTVYKGGRYINVYRPLEIMPVFAISGAIIPMTDKITANDVQTNPDKLVVKVYPGEKGSFSMYEDDGDSQNYLSNECVFTDMVFDNNSGCATFTVQKPRGNSSLLPESRSYCIEFVSFDNAAAKVFVDCVAVNADITYDSDDKVIRVDCPSVSSASQIEIRFESLLRTADNNIDKLVTDTLMKCELDFATKNRLYNAAIKTNASSGLDSALTELISLDAPKDLVCAITEIITANN